MLNNSAHVCGNKKKSVWEWQVDLSNEKVKFPLQLYSICSVFFLQNYILADIWGSIDLSTSEVLYPLQLVCISKDV